MKKALSVFVVISLLSGCSENVSATEDLGKRVYVVEDKSRGVVCYVYKGHKAGGLHCFTSKQLKGSEE